MKYVFPFCLVGLHLGAAICSVCVKDIAKGIYYFAGAVLNISVIFMGS